MGKVTFVFEYEDGAEPAVHREMRVAGGRLTAAAFSDTIEKLDSLRDAVDKYRNDLKTIYDHPDADISIAGAGIFIRAGTDKHKGFIVGVLLASLMLKHPDEVR